MAAAYFDIGVNYAGKRFKPTRVRSLLAEAAAVGVRGVVSISNALAEVPLNAALARDNPGLYFTAGVHPHGAKTITRPDQLDVLHDVARDPKCVAIGEWYVRLP